MAEKQMKKLNNAFLSALLWSFSIENRQKWFHKGLWNLKAFLISSRTEWPKTTINLETKDVGNQKLKSPFSPLAYLSPPLRSLSSL